MPRKADPEFIEKIRALGAKGYTQTEIAKKCDTNQPRISYLMKAYGIERHQYGLQRRNREAVASRGIRTCVQVWAGNTLLHTQLNATSTQLRRMADLIDGYVEQAIEKLEAQEAANADAPV